MDAALDVVVAWDAGKPAWVFLVRVAGMALAFVELLFKLVGALRKTFT